MGNSAERRVQFAQESTKYTAQAAVYRLVGMEGDVDFDPQWDQIGGFTGGFAETSGRYIAGRQGTGRLQGPLLRDVEGLIPFRFSMHEMTKTGVATPYTYEFATQFEPSALNVPTFTLETGDKVEIIRGVGGIVTGWTLTGAISQAVQINSDLQFADADFSQGAFTVIAPGTPDYSVPERLPPVVLTNNMHLLVDGVDYESDLTAFGVTYASGRALVPSINGTLALDEEAWAVPTVRATFSLKTGANEASMITKLLAATPHLFTLQNDASAPTFSLSFAGQVTKPNVIEDTDGRSTIEFNVMEVYQPDTQAEILLVTLITPNASLA